MVSRGARAKPRSSVTSAQPFQRRPGRSGLTWSIVTGDTPPQSSMPASSSTPKSSDRLGGACRWMSGGSTSRAAATVQSVLVGRARLAARCMAVSGLGRKFWTITSCTWPCRACDAAIASRASSRSDRVSPMPTRMPVVNGMASWPAASSVARRRSGCLVRRAGVAFEVGAQALEHHALRRRHRAQHGQLVGRRARRRWRGGAAPSRRAPARTWRRGRPRSSRSPCSASQVDAAG